MRHTVGISEMQVSENRDDVLVTYSLGSCIGLALYDPERGMGGLVHCMLPLSKIDKARAEERPCMFIDTGVIALINALLTRGSTKRSLVAKVAGAARLLNDNRAFRIGERNRVVLRKVLWKNNILISAEDTGGTIARTMSLELATGRTTIKANGRLYELK